MQKTLMIGGLSGLAVLLAAFVGYQFIVRTEKFPAPTPETTAPLSTPQSTAPLPTPPPSKAGIHSPVDLPKRCETDRDCHVVFTGRCGCEDYEALNTASRKEFERRRAARETQDSATCEFVCGPSAKYMESAFCKKDPATDVAECQGVWKRRF